MRTELLVCPHCYANIIIEHANTIYCNVCGKVGIIKDNIPSFINDDETNLYFDDFHELMMENNEKEVVWRLFFLNQHKLIEKEFLPNKVIVDIGCGPETLYCKGTNCTLIGVDSSFRSLKKNTSLDLKIHTKAQLIPLPSSSVDCVICVYLIHHIIGKTIKESRNQVYLALQEFSRILKPGGKLLIFDILPWYLTWLIESSLWNIAKLILGEKLDYFFWNFKALNSIAKDVLPGGLVKTKVFHSNWIACFRPVFAIEWLVVPRFLYPLDVCALEWRKQQK